MNRKEGIRKMAEAYYQMLTALKPAIKKNPDIKAGLKEGLGKFLSNLYISYFGKKNTDYYSEAAYKIKDDKNAKLVFEHIVPKARYIQEPCYEASIKGHFEDGKEFSVESIEGLLNKYWKIATVTKEENEKLNKYRTKMPESWKPGDDPFARYDAVGIKFHK